MSALELIAVVALIVPAFRRRLAGLVPIAATFVAAETLVFIGIHFASGSTSMGPVIYWLVVAAVCAFIIYGRRVLVPIRRGEFA